MKPNSNRNEFAAIAALMLITAFALIALVYHNTHQPSQISAAGTSHFTSNVSMAGTLAVTGASTLTGAVTTSANATVGAMLITASSTITPTDGGTITPTKSLVYVTGLTAYTGTAVGYCGSTNGLHLTVVNTINQSLVLTETGGLVSAGNITLGQWDSATFICIANTWVQTGASNN